MEAAQQEKVNYYVCCPLLLWPVCFVCCMMSVTVCVYSHMLSFCQGQEDMWCMSCTRWRPERYLASKTFTSYLSWNVLSFHSSSFTTVSYPIWEGHSGVKEDVCHVWQGRVKGNRLILVHQVCVWMCVCVQLLWLMVMLGYVLALVIGTC